MPPQAQSQAVVKFIDQVAKSFKIIVGIYL
jgi:hypothetical protein